MRSYRSQIAQRSAIFILPLFALAVWSALGPPAAHTAKVGQPAPEFSGGPWINGAPLTLTDLRGKVVLVEFWTYG
jgi:hypothetical protein